MEQIRILYVDDVIDPVISKHLSAYRMVDVEISYDEIEFSIGRGYESLVCDRRVTSANVIFIDSQLFQNSTAVNGKYTGEYFKLILRKFFPYIEVIVITQNEIPDEYTSTIAKYNPKSENPADKYYDELFEKTIGNAITRIREYRAIVCDFNPDSETSYIIDKISNSLDGIDTYDELKKSDIDNIVNLFKSLQERLDG